tara:strand:+ start:18619 stop:19746 length:1128 start_codon:yes stop_codon:yes gene_type:complete
MHRVAAFIVSALLACQTQASGIPKFDFANFILETALHNLEEEVQGQLEHLVSAEMQFVADLAGLEIDSRLDLKSLSTAVQTSVESELSRVNALASNMVPRNACQMYSTVRALGTTFSPRSWGQVSAYRKFGPRVVASVIDSGGSDDAVNAQLSVVKKELFEELVSTFKEQPGRYANNRSASGGLDAPILSELMNRSHTPEAESQLPWATSLIAGDSQTAGVNLKPGNNSANKELRVKELMVRMGKSSLAEWALSDVLRHKRSATGRLTKSELAKVIDVDPSSLLINEVMVREADEEGTVGLSTELLLSLALKAPYLTEKQQSAEVYREDHTAEIRKTAYQTAARAYSEELQLYNDISSLASEAIALGLVLEDLTH